MVNFDNICVFQNLLEDEVVLKTHCFPRSALTIYFPFLFLKPALAILFPANKFPNKLAPKVSNYILKNPPFRSFVSFIIVLVTPFSKILESSRA